MSEIVRGLQREYLEELVLKMHALIKSQ